MSKNFFAALDDSGDEAEKTNVVKQEKRVPPHKAPVAEPSKPDRRRNPNKNDRNTKGGRGGRVPTRDGKRAYDRRSGTGRGREIKKGGGGARNWGNDKNEARRAEGAITESQEEPVLGEEKPENGGEEDRKSGDENVVDETAKEENPKEEEMEPEEEEDKTISYEEYMKNKQLQSNETELFAPRELKEVENEFAGKAPKVHQEEEFLVMGGGKQPRKKASKKEEKKIDFVPQFKVTTSAGGGGGRRNRDRRDGGDRRGAKGGRGGKSDRSSGHGRGGGGDRRSTSSEIDVADSEAFPSL